MEEASHKYLDCAGTRIYLLNDYLNDNQCKSLIASIKDTGQKQNVVRMPALAQDLWEYIGPKISEQVFFDQRNERHFKIVAISDHITITNNSTPTPVHIDMKVRATDRFKLAFFLNKVQSGGTIFYDGIPFTGDRVKEILIPNNSGSGILFDLWLSHKGEEFVLGNKIMIGARPIINYID
jgi:hypothetical protein